MTQLCANQKTLGQKRSVCGKYGCRRGKGLQVDAITGVSLTVERDAKNRVFDRVTPTGVLMDQAAVSHGITFFRLNCAHT